MLQLQQSWHVPSHVVLPCTALVLTVAPFVLCSPACACLPTGMVKRVRGVSYSMKVSPQNTNRMVSL
jgi:hypothetical protein